MVPKDYWSLEALGGLFKRHPVISFLLDFGVSFALVVAEVYIGSLAVLVTIGYWSIPW